MRLKLPCIMHWELYPYRKLPTYFSDEAKVFAGDQSQNYLIMKNGSNNIGLFQGMFEENIITFNPGWDQDANSVEPFTDVRDLHKHFKSQGIEIAQESITGDAGPSSFSVIDPDGNSILIDQHV